MANPNLKRAVRVALLAASAGSALYGTVSVAQDAELEQVIVTGSRIPQPNLEGTSPVSVVGAEEIKFRGVQQVEDLINNCLLYTSPSPRDRTRSRMPSSA